MRPRVKGDCRCCENICTRIAAVCAYANITSPVRMNRKGIAIVVHRKNCTPLAENLIVGAATRRVDPGSKRECGSQVQIRTVSYADVIVDSIKQETRANRARRIARAV